MLAEMIGWPEACVFMVAIVCATVLTVRRAWPW
jgi:hypothetical protein